CSPLITVNWPLIRPLSYTIKALHPDWTLPALSWRATVDLHRAPCPTLYVKLTIAAWRCGGKLSIAGIHFLASASYRGKSAASHCLHSSGVAVSPILTGRSTAVTP